MGKWSSQASAFSTKVNNCNNTLDDGLTEIQGIYSELEFDATKEDSLAFNTNLFTKKVEEAINDTKEDNLNITSKVTAKAEKLDEEEHLKTSIINNLQDVNIIKKTGADVINGFFSSDTTDYELNFDGYASYRIDLVSVKKKEKIR